MAEGYLPAGCCSSADSRGQKTDDKYGFLAWCLARQRRQPKQFALRVTGSWIYSKTYHLVCGPYLHVIIIKLPHPCLTRKAAKHEVCMIAFFRLLRWVHASCLYMGWPRRTAHSIHPLNVPARLSRIVQTALSAPSTTYVAIISWQRRSLRLASCCAICRYATSSRRENATCSALIKLVWNAANRDVAAL